MDALLEKCPEQWVAQNIKRSIINLVGIKQDIELAHKRSIEINETPFVDECGKYYHSN